MPIRSGILSFGLVAIPVKVYPATKDETVRFNLLHAKCGNRVQNQWFCPVDNEVVPREQLVRGAQVGKDQYVQITDQELEALEVLCCPLFHNFQSPPHSLNLKAGRREGFCRSPTWERSTITFHF